MVDGQEVRSLLDVFGGGGDADEEQLKGSEGVQYVEVQCGSVTPTLQHKATKGEKLGCNAFLGSARGRPTPPLPCPDCFTS